MHFCRKKNLLLSSIDLMEAKIQDIPRRRGFPMNRFVPGITTTQASGEWKAPRQSHERIGARAACLHVIRSHHVRVHCVLPRRFLSRIMVGLNYYVAPSFEETTVKVSCNPDCNLRTCSSLRVRALTTTTLLHNTIIQQTSSGMGGAYN